MSLNGRPPFGLAGPADPRRAITLENLLEMRDGLDFFEDYVDDRVSDVIEMLFGGRTRRRRGFAASRPLAHAPGRVFNYSSGTSNIVSRVMCDAIGGGPDQITKFFRGRLFDPIGMTSADPRFDDAGTFIGSSYLYATARRIGPASDCCTYATDCGTARGYSPRAGSTTAVARSVDRPTATAPRRALVGRGRRNWAASAPAATKASRSLMLSGARPRRRATGQDARGIR